MSSSENVAFIRVFWCYSSLLVNLCMWISPLSLLCLNTRCLYVKQIDSHSAIVMEYCPANLQQLLQYCGLVVIFNYKNFFVNFIFDKMNCSSLWLSAVRLTVSKWRYLMMLCDKWPLTWPTPSITCTAKAGFTSISSQKTFYLTNSPIQNW